MSVDRTSYIAGLRVLAGILEQHDELPLPYHGTASELLWIHHGDSVEQRRIAQTFARLLPGTVEKAVRDDAFDLIGRVEGVGVQLIVQRDAVCKRVVKGTREVTRQVPDPELLAAIPLTTVTETVEEIEWDCSPILADPERVSA